MGIALAVVGVVVALVSLTADLTGISDDPGFQVGPIQASGILLGVVVAVVGVVMVMRYRSS